MRKLVFVTGAKAELDDFPVTAKSVAGRQLRLIQYGYEPADWKPMTTVGPGVAEIRIWDETGAYRVLYVAKFKDAVYVLHCFKKKSQKTDRRDLEIATVRYRTLVQR